MTDKDRQHAKDMLAIGTVARELRVELEQLREDAERLAGAVSGSLKHGEDSPLADALKAYLLKYPWTDL